MATKVDPRHIRTDLGTQMRVDWSEETVKEYAELMEQGVEFPPLLVFFDVLTNLLILVDGFHRLAAHLRVRPNDQILVELRPGNLEEAKWAAITANQSHGIRRTNADKRNAVKRALLHQKGANKSDCQIAEHTGVDHKTVGAVRRELEATDKIPQIESRIVQRGKQTYLQKTSGINANRKDGPSVAVSLPSNNAKLFAVELREFWEKPYLIECLVALKQFLDDEECS